MRNETATQTHTALRGDGCVTRTPNARKSMGEYKPVMVIEIDTGRTNPEGRPIIQKRTEVIGTSYDGVDFETGGMKLGKFGKFRGITYTARADAIAHAAHYIEDLEKRIDADEAKRAARSGDQRETNPTKRRTR